MSAKKQKPHWAGSLVSLFVLAMICIPMLDGHNTLVPSYGEDPTTVQSPAIGKLGHLSTMLNKAREQYEDIGMTPFLRTRDDAPVPVASVATDKVSGDAPAPSPAPVVITPATTTTLTAVAKLEGPETIENGGFAVSYSVTPGARVVWNNKYPPKAMPPMRATDENGQTMLAFLNSVPGTYKFSLLVQVPNKEGDGLDPLATAEWSVVVGTIIPTTTTTTTTVPTTPTTTTTTPLDKVTSVTYVHDIHGENDKPIPSAVRSGLNRLNIEKNILATIVEIDSPDGTGDVPEQYKLDIEAAKKEGLPAVVSRSGDKVLKVVKDPSTEEQIYSLAP